MFFSIDFKDFFERITNPGKVKDPVEGEGENQRDAIPSPDAYAA